MPQLMRKIANTPKAAAAAAPIPTRLSILGEPLKRLRKPLTKYLRFKSKIGIVKSSWANAEVTAFSLP